MKHRFVILLALGSASACAWLVSACGGADNTNIDGGGNDATTSDTSSDSPTNNDAANNDAANNEAGNPNPDGGCAKGPGCRTCCAAQYPDAAAFFTTTEETCACTTPGDCKNQCANTLCMGKQPPTQSQCEACLFNKDAGDCYAAAVSACTANAGCQQLEVCVASCGGGGPTDAGGGG
jgi:hypothetical protein